GYLRARARSRSTSPMGNQGSSHDSQASPPARPRASTAVQSSVERRPSRLSLSPSPRLALPPPYGARTSLSFAQSSVVSMQRRSAVVRAVITALALRVVQLDSLTMPVQHTVAVDDLGER